MSRGRKTRGYRRSAPSTPHDLFAQESLDFVERHQDEPFFLYLAFTLPHANNERGRAEGDGMEVPSYEPYADKPWPQPQKGHAAMISRLDGDVGRLLNRLETLGLADDTIVFFTSDNGTHKEGGADPAFFGSSGPLRGYKRDLYEGGIRVPMIVRWPGCIAAGDVSATPWAFWDFFPTAAELGGAAAPDGLDGVSMAAALKGGPAPAHQPFYWEFHERGLTQAIRMDRWKAVQRADSPMELFDLARDISERNDVAAENPHVARTMEEYFETARTPSVHWPTEKDK